MSLLDKKVLISGCGLSWSGQKRKTWVNVLKLTGLTVIDVGGPAVSNQWILNSAIEYVLANNVDYVVIQLSSLGKLDVEINNAERQAELVNKDELRNFTVNGIWPSSVSIDHIAKQQWQQWLFSPRLEIQDIEVKLRLLKFYCDSKGIALLVLKGYNLPTDALNDIIYNPLCLYDDYVNSTNYVYHDHSEQNAVPCIEFQFEIAKLVDHALALRVTQRLEKVSQQYWQKNNLQSQTNVL